MIIHVTSVDAQLAKEKAQHHHQSAKGHDRILAFLYKKGRNLKMRMKIM
jgi:hypothetical protein